MNSKYLIEENLRRVNARARRLRFLQHTSTLGVITALLFLLLAAALISGWSAHPLLVRALIAVLVVAAVLAWMVIGISILSSEPRRQWLAGLLERNQPQLLDRLNTMVYLENPARRNPLIRSFYLRIAKQAQGVLLQKTPSAPLPRARPLLHLLAFIVVLAATVWVYEQYLPWERFMAAREQRLAQQAEDKVEPEAPLELALPTNNLVEQQQGWGEVRITEPARDLQVTKVDVVPLQIEAAANEKIQKVGWTSTINGMDEKPHELPAPADARFAVYQPTLYLDELRLSDWDVLTYYAKANTEKDISYASEVYFLEVRPFREDILKLPGGEGGQAYQCLNELTALINQQQHVIRQTHQHIQRPPEQSHLQTQDRSKLADAEKDLSQSANHLYAKMATEMENKPIGEALDQLAKAEKELGRASQSLRDDVMNEAQNRERSALAELVAARKAFQKAVSENPKAFEEPKEEEPPPPIAEDLKKLKEMAEFRNEARAAQDFVQQTAAKQRDIARKATGSSRTNYNQLASEERTLQKSLDDFASQHPKMFNDVKPEMSDAQQAMTQTAEALQKRNLGARTNAQESVKQLEKLKDAMQNESSDQQLADAYKLKQMLDKQIETMSQCQQSGDGMSGQGMKETVGQTRETLKQLKSTAEQQPTRDAFGPQLRESLGDLKMVSLNWPLSELENAQDGEGRKKAAGKAKEELSKVSKAFEESEPQALQAARKNDSLKPGEQESLERGLAQLESLLKQLENQKPISEQNRAKQGQEALFNLQTGLRNQYGSNERGNQIMVQLERELKPGETPEVGNIRKLMDELRKFSLELTSQQAKKEDEPEVTNIDPTRLPPAYRGRIEKYFQRLSEK